MAIIGYVGWGGNLCLLTNRRGNTISLVQQGSQTARNRNRKMARNVTQLTVPPNAMMMWNSDAQVLNNTWPECGNLVVGFQ